MEIELKLALDPASVAGLRRHPLLAGRKPSRAKLYSLYFDTPGFDLFQAGIALRLRRVGYQWVQTVKAEADSTGALSARPEWEVRVTGNRPDLSVLPDEARALFRPAWMKKLAPVFLTEFQRAAWRLQTDSGEVELALDQGRIVAGELDCPISEVELELKSGRPEALFELAEPLTRDHVFVLEPRSKALRGYQLCGALAPRPVKSMRVGLTPDMPAGQAWQSMIRAALAQFAGNVVGCADPDEPEYLHQARVAIRRLRSTVNLTRRLDVPAPAWNAELKWLMDEFNPARDWDVFHTETLPRLYRALGQQPGWEALLEAVSRRRLEANRRARRALDGGRGARLLLAIEADLLAAHPQTQPAGLWAMEVLDRRLRQLRRLGKDLERLDAASRHQVRIAAKRLRYAADAFGDLYGERVPVYLTRLTALQDVLGQANDATIAARLLAELRHADDMASDPSLARLAGLLEGYLLGDAGCQAMHVTRIWRELQASKPFWKRPAKPAKG